MSDKFLEERKRVLGSKAVVEPVLIERTTYDFFINLEPVRFSVVTGEAAMAYAKEHGLFLRMDAVQGTMRYTPEQVDDLLATVDADAIGRFFYCHRIEVYRELEIRIDDPVISAAYANGKPVVPLSRFDVSLGMVHLVIDAYLLGCERGRAGACKAG